MVLMSTWRRRERSRRRAARSRSASSQSPAAEIEEYLDAKGIKWEFLGSVDADQFDQAASLNNQARWESLNESRAETYSEAMKRGDVFPPVNAGAEPGRLLVSDGSRTVAGAVNITCQVGNSDSRAGSAVSDGPAVVPISSTVGSSIRGTIGRTACTERHRLRPNEPERLSGPAPAAGGLHHVAGRSPNVAARAAAEQVTYSFLAEYAATSAKAYAADLKAAFAYFETLGLDPLQLTRGDVARYVGHLLHERGLAVSTVRRRLASMSGFFEVAVEQRWVQANPVRRVRRPRPRAVPVKVTLTSAQMTALLNAAERHSVRLAVLVHLQLLHGCRVGEVLGADAADFVDEAGRSTLRVRCKGGDLRRLVLVPTTAELISTLLNGRRDGPLLLSDSGRRWHRTTASRLLKQVACTVLEPAVGERLHPHALRRAFCDAGLDAGVSLPELQAALGHRSSAMTLAYATAHRSDRLPVSLRVAASLRPQKGTAGRGIAPLPSP